MERNGEIEMWRFVVSLIIVDFHFVQLRLFPSGRIGVEFFFLLSGYLLAAGIMKNKEENSPSWKEIHQGTGSLIWRRICSYFPETFLACSIACIVYVLAYQPDFFSFVEKMVATMFGEVCFLGMSGLFSRGATGVTWYLSTLLFSTCIIYPVVRRWGISPCFFVAGVLLLGMIYIDGEAVDFIGVKYYIAGTYKGNIRGFAEMLIGVSLYPVARKLGAVAISERGRMLLTLVKWGMFTCFLCYAHCAGYVRSNAGFSLYMICGMLILSFSGQCVDRFWYQHRFILFLGRLSLPLYLSHGFYADALPKLLPTELPCSIMYALYILCAVVTAFFVMYAARWLRVYVPAFFIARDVK